MELTHKLRIANVTWHTETEIRLLDPYRFSYVIEGGQYPDTTEWVLSTQDLTPNVGMVTLPYSPSISNGRNISSALYIPAGSYIVKTVSSGGFLRLYRLRGSLVTGQYADLIGEYHDGDQITLTSNNSLYVIADSDMHSVGNLQNYISSYEEIEVQVPTKTYTNFPISEPIGWDNFAVNLKRHDYHGIGAEVSMDMLEFYGSAYTKIKSAYDSDIDSEILYVITDTNQNVIYSGRIDLSTCSFLHGDYQSVKVKVGEVGSMTTFNNRTDKDVDLDNPSTIDGRVVDIPDALLLKIPQKHLLYTNVVKIITETKVDTDQEGYTGQGVKFNIDYPYVMVPCGEITTNEFGTIELPQVGYFANNTTSFSPQYTASEDHIAKYGTSTTVSIDVKFVILAETFSTSFETSPTGNFSFRLCAKDGNNAVIQGAWHSVALNTIRGENRVFRMDCELSGTLSAGNNIRLYLETSYGDVSQSLKPYRSMRCVLTLQSGTIFKMTMYDNITDADCIADMIRVHDALNIVSHAISENELSVKSDWYQTPESKWNAGAIRTSANGGSGALKAITNGYRIRGLFTDRENKRNMPLSFKSLIESLDALDCIGWGFSTESGVLYVRVEKWDWFYKDTTVLTLTNVAEVTTEVYTDRIPTELKIGYKKYATQDQYNSIDSPHGTRTFVSGIKALSKALTKECEFVADNYAIEETRRARKAVSETEETTYDENIFVFELLRYFNTTTSKATYSIGTTATNATNVGRASEFINAKLTPRHMAARWRAFLFSANNSTPFRFTAGEINYKASFGVLAEYAYTSLNIYRNTLHTDHESSTQVENDNISYSHAKFKAEKISFSYPLSISQYRSVKANPYGLISVNGVLGWILDFKYSLADGMADFVLIAKNS